MTDKESSDGQLEPLVTLNVSELFGFRQLRKVGYPAGAWPELSRLLSKVGEGGPPPGSKTDAIK